MNTLTYIHTVSGVRLLQPAGAEHSIRNIPNVAGIPRTNFRIAWAWLQGANTDRVVDMVRTGQEVRAMCRAAMICDTRTPFAYFDAWPEPLTMRPLYGDGAYFAESADMTRQGQSQGHSIEY